MPWEQCGPPPATEWSAPAPAGDVSVHNPTLAIITRQASAEISRWDLSDPTAPVMEELFAWPGTAGINALGACVVDEEEEWAYVVNFGTNADTWRFYSFAVNDLAGQRAMLDLKAALGLSLDAVTSRWIDYDPVGKVVYVGTTFQGMVMVAVDVSDPLNPVVADFHSLPPAGSSGANVDWTFNADHSLWFIEQVVSPQFRIHEVSAPGTIGAEVGSVVMDFDRATVTWYGPDQTRICVRTQEDLWIIDVSDPAAPAVIAGPLQPSNLHLFTNYPTFAVAGSTVSERVLFYNAGHNNERRFFLVDFSTPTAPVVVAEGTMCSGAASCNRTAHTLRGASVYPDESHVLIADESGTRIIRDPFTAPTEIAFFGGVDSGTGVATRWGAGYTSAPEVGDAVDEWAACDAAPATPWADC